MGAVSTGIEANACRPLRDQAGILTGGQGTIGATPRGEQDISWALWKRPQVVIDSLASLFRDLERDRPARLSLTDGGSLGGIAARRDVIDTERDEIAAPQLAIDCEIEQGEVPYAATDHQSRPYRPNVLGLEWRLWTEITALVPRSIFPLAIGALRCRFHGQLLEVDEAKHFDATG